MIATFVTLAVAATLFDDPCDPAGRDCPTHFGGVGILVIKGECAFFAPQDDDKSGGLIRITDTGSFRNGAFVWVSGTLQAFCPAECGSTGGCILDNIIGTPFQGCGTLQVGPQSCTVFAADSGEGYVLANEGKFAVGARVYVEGCIDLRSPLCQPLTVPGLLDNTIEPCFEVCGTLSIGPQSCTLVVVDGQGYAVGNSGGFSSATKSS